MGTEKELKQIDVIELDQEIYQLKGQLDKCIKHIYFYMQEYSRLKKVYTDEIAKTLFALKGGESITWQGKTISGITTNAKEIAKGICSEHELNMDIAQNKLEALKQTMENYGKQLSALQSINRHISKI